MPPDRRVRDRRQSSADNDTLSLAGLPKEVREALRHVVERTKRLQLTEDEAGEADVLPDGAEDGANMTDGGDGQGDPPESA